MSPAEHETDGQRWKARPVLAALVMAGFYAIPLSFSLLAVVVLARIDLLAGHRWLSLGLLAVTALAVSLLLERFVRRLLPIAALLRLTMLFPDRAPTRFKVARAAASSTRLQALDGAGDLSDAAERALALMTALGAHDRRTRGHSERVRVFGDMLAEQLRLDQDDRDRLRWASLLHDIGKLQIPHALLNKPAKLDDAEFALIKTHPEIGAELTVTLLPWLGEWGRGISEHHEKYDGSGYPFGLAGQDISPSGRLIGLVDAFETMTAARAYKKATATRAAREELARCAGTHFDPTYVRAFLGVSLPKLIWAMGPLSFLSQLPFLRIIASSGARTAVAGEVATTVAGAAVVATVGVANAYGGAPLQPQRAPSTAAAELVAAPAAGPTMGPVPVGRALAPALPLAGPVAPPADAVPLGPTAPAKAVPLTVDVPVQGPTAPVQGPTAPATEGPTPPAQVVVQPSADVALPTVAVPVLPPKTPPAPTRSPVTVVPAPTPPPATPAPQPTPAASAAPPVIVASPTLPPVIGPVVPPFIGPTVPPVVVGQPPVVVVGPPVVVPPVVVPPVVLPPVVVLPSPIVVPPVAVPPVVVVPSPVLVPPVVVPSSIAVPPAVLPPPVVVGAASYIDPPTGEHLAATQTFRVTPVAGATGYQCQVDGGGWAPCINPQSFTLPPGPHTVMMRAVIGVVPGDAATTSYALTDPTVTFVTSPPAVDTAHSARFDMVAAPGLTLQCSLNGTPYSPCPANHRFPGLASGPQTLAVRPVNTLGEIGTATTYSWVVAP